MTESLSQYQKYKHLIIANNAKKTTCICGSITRYDKRYVHLKTKKHQRFISTV